MAEDFGGYVVPDLADLSSGQRASAVPRSSSGAHGSEPEQPVSEDSGETRDQPESQPEAGAKPESGDEPRAEPVPDEDRPQEQHEQQDADKDDSADSDDVDAGFTGVVALDETVSLNPNTESAKLRPRVPGQTPQDASEPETVVLASYDEVEAEKKASAQRSSGGKAKRASVEPPPTVVEQQMLVASPEVENRERVVPGAKDMHVKNVPSAIGDVLREILRQAKTLTVYSNNTVKLSPVFTDVSRIGVAKIITAYVVATLNLPVQGISKTESQMVEVFSRLDPAATRSTEMLSRLNTVEDTLGQVRSTVNVSRNYQDSFEYVLSYLVADSLAAIEVNGQSVSTFDPTKSPVDAVRDRIRETTGNAVKEDRRRAARRAVR